ncbi:hypothetical protein AX17_003483 [Amanita inopinata Kibby_2008]|nr:hypothetical protein AX17_003483 [Amanita inopinata Kibby_2008]
MNTVVDNMDALLIEAQKAKGWKWVHEEPLWLTWSMEKFGTAIRTALYSNIIHSVPSVTSFAEIIPPYHRSLAMHTQLVDRLRSNSVSFEDSQEAIAKWVEQPWLGDSGWETRWEDICTVEVERWETSR